MALEIYTSGDMAYMEAIMTGLGHVYNDGFMGQIFAMALLCNAVLSLARYISDQQSGFLTSFWQAIILYLIMFSSTTKIVLYKENEGYRPIAGDFPIGVMAPAHYISLIGHKIAERFKDNIIAVDTGWSMSSNTALLDHGLSPLESLLAIRNASVDGMFEKSDLLSLPENPGNASSGIETSMRNYYEDCVFKAIALSKFDADAKAYRDKFTSSINSEDQWGSLFVDEGWVTEVTLDQNSYYSTCSVAHGHIKTALDQRANEVIMNHLFPMTKSDSSKSRSEYFDELKDMWLKMNPNNNAQSLYRLSANHFTHYTSRGACSNSPALGYAAVQACAAQYDSIMERRYTEASKSESFLEMLKPMVTFIEGFVYAISPFMIVLVLFSGAGGLKMMGKYFSALLWIVLIPICNVLIDVYLNVYFNKWLNAAFSGDSAGASMASISSQESIWMDLESFVAFAGTAQAMAPALAMFIIFAGVHTLQGMGASLAAGASVSGNKLNSNQAVAVKDGQHSYSSDSGNVSKDKEGNWNYDKVTTTSSAPLDANASNAVMSMGNQTALADRQATSLQEVASAKKMATNQSVQNYAFSDQYSNGFDYKTSSANEMSKSQMKALAIAESLNKDWGMDKASAHEVGTKIVAAAGAGGSIDASMKMGKLKLSAGAQADLKTALDDSSKYGEKATTSEKFAEMMNESEQMSQKIDEKYAEAASRGEAVNTSETFTEQEQRSNQATADYNQALGISKELSKAESISWDSKATTGNFFAAAGQNSGAIKSLLDGTVDDAFRSEYLLQATGLGNVDSSQIEDKQWSRIAENLQNGDLYSMSNDDWNAINKIAGDDSQLSQLGINQKSDGSWGVMTGQQYAAQRMNMSQSDFSTAYERLSNEDKSGSGERSNFLHRYAQSFTSDLDNFENDNKREAHLATAAAFDKMSSHAQHDVVGVDPDKGIHDGMRAFASQFETMAEDVYGIESNLKDTQMKEEFVNEILGSGREANAIEQSQTVRFDELLGKGDQTIARGKQELKGKVADVQQVVNKDIDSTKTRMPTQEDFRGNMQELWKTAQNSKDGFVGQVDNRIADQHQDFYDNISRTGVVGDYVLNDVFDAHMRHNDKMEIQNPTTVAEAAAVYDSYQERSSAIGDLLSDSPQISEASNKILQGAFSSGEITQKEIDQLKTEIGADKVDSFVKENNEFMSDLKELTDGEDVNAQRAFGMMMNHSKYRDAFSDYQSSGDRGQLDIFRQGLQERSSLPTKGELAETLENKTVDHKDLANGVALRKMTSDFYEAMAPFKGISNLNGWGASGDVHDYIRGESSDLNAAVKAFEGKAIHNDTDALRAQLETAHSIYSDINKFEDDLLANGGKSGLAAALTVAHNTTDEQMNEILAKPQDSATLFRDLEGDDGMNAALNNTMFASTLGSTPESFVHEQNKSIINKYGLENLTEDVIEEVGEFKVSDVFSSQDPVLKDTPTGSADYSALNAKAPEENDFFKAGMKDLSVTDIVKLGDAARSSGLTTEELIYARGKESVTGIHDDKYSLGGSEDLRTASTGGSFAWNLTKEVAQGGAKEALKLSAESDAESKEMEKQERLQFITPGIRVEDISEYSKYLSADAYNQYLEDYKDLARELKDASSLVTQGKMSISELNQQFPLVNLPNLSQKYLEDTWGPAHYELFKKDELAFFIGEGGNTLKRGLEVVESAYIGAMPWSFDDNGNMTSFNPMPNAVSTVGGAIVGAVSKGYQNFWEDNGARLIPYAISNGKDLDIRTLWLPPAVEVNK